MPVIDTSETFRCLPHSEGGQAGSCQRKGMSWKSIHYTPGKCCPYCSGKVASEATNKAPLEPENPLPHMLTELEAAGIIAAQS